MKNRNLKIAIIAAILTSISSAGAMGRFFQAYANPVYSKVANSSARVIVRPGTTRKWTVMATPLELFLTGKGYIQRSFNAIRHNVKKGIFPPNEELDQLGRISKINNYWILNQADAHGHTILKDAFENGNHSYAYKRFMKALINRGAALNNRDKYIIGDEGLLKAYLNLPFNATATTTLKVFRTFLTKTTNKSKYGKMTSEEITKAKNITDLFPKTENKLLAQRETERSAKKHTLVVY